MFNLVKRNTCFKDEGSSIDLLTNRKYSFKNTCFFEVGLSDHHHLMYSVMKTIFKSEEPKKLIYRYYSNFCSERFRDDFMTSICHEKHGYSDFEVKFIATLNKHAPQKIKTFRDNEKPHVNKTLHKAIMKRSQLKNRTNKTRNATDVSDYKNQRNYVVKLNNRGKKDHFDRLNSEKYSKLFWKSCKSYFSNKYSFGETRIALSENGKFLTENNKIAKTFNSSLIQLRYYVSFKVRKFESFSYKINTCLQKATTCNEL